jgi:type IV pilus assembly protein PilB
MTTEANITGLARRLVSDRLLDQEAAVAACSGANVESLPLVRHLVKHRLVDSRPLALAAAREFRLPLLDLSALDLGALPLSLVDARLLKKHNVIPLMRRGNRLFLGMSDPSDSLALNEIKFHTGLIIEPVIVEEDKLTDTLHALLRSDEETSSVFASLEGMGLDELDIELVDENKAVEDESDGSDDAPIVRFVNKVLFDAIKLGASDIHIEPYEKLYRIRYRQDGILREVARPPLGIAGRIASRIKIMSGMDISERRIPQDGRIKLKLSRSKAIDFRVNTLPTLWGERSCCVSSTQAAHSWASTCWVTRRTRSSIS